MSFESLDNFLINLSFQVNSEILMKNREEVSYLNKGKLSRNFLLTAIICQMSLLFRDTLETHTQKDFQKHSKANAWFFHATVNTSHRAGCKISGALVWHKALNLQRYQ